MERIIYSNYDPELGDEFWLEDERMNLDVQLKNPILVLMDLGLWNGRKQGCFIIDSGNVRDILYSECDYVKWYSDGHDIKARASHHDGTNHYKYREIRDPDNIGELIDAIYMGEKISEKKLNHYTKSLEPVVAKIYGWNEEKKH